MERESSVDWLGGLTLFESFSFSRPTSAQQSSTRSTGSAARRSPRFLQEDGSFDLTVAAPSRENSGEGLLGLQRSPGGLFRRMSQTFSRAASVFSFRSGSAGSTEREPPPAPPNTNIAPLCAPNGGHDGVQIAGRLGLFENMVSSPNFGGAGAAGSLTSIPTAHSPGLFRRLSSTFAPCNPPHQSGMGLSPVCGAVQAPVEGHLLSEQDDPAEIASQIEEYCWRQMGIKSADLKPNAVMRIQDLFVLFRSLEDRGIVRLEPAAAGRLNSIFGFERIFVEDVNEFNKEFADMVQADHQRCWLTNGKRSLVQPTLPAYELLRQLGVHPVKGTRGREGAAGGKRDFLFYSQYTFTLGRMQKNCSRLKIGVIGNRRGGGGGGGGGGVHLES